MKAGAYLSTMVSWPGNLPALMSTRGAFMARTVRLTLPPESAQMVYLLFGSMFDRYFSKSKVAIREDEDMVFDSTVEVARCLVYEVLFLASNPWVRSIAAVKHYIAWVITSLSHLSQNHIVQELLVHLSISVFQLCPRSLLRIDAPIHCILSKKPHASKCTPFCCRKSSIQ